MSVASKEEDRRSLHTQWLGWYLQGIDIGVDKERALMNNGFINRDFKQIAEVKKRQRAFNLGRDYVLTSNETENLANSFVDVHKNGEIIHKNITEEDEVLEAEEYVRRTKNKNYSFQGISGIEKSAWSLDSGEMYNWSNDFYDWIRSINRGWQGKIEYHKFNLYKQQAHEWINERIKYDIQEDEESRFHYLRLERKRCLENTLYGLVKFLNLKEGQVESGKRKFDPYESQALVLFLLDLGISYMAAKLRQIGYSSVIGGGSMMKTMLSKNFFCKFVTEKGTKGTEIYDDKIRYALDTFPAYLVPSVLHDQATGMLRFAVKEEKGRRSGANSKYQVEPPYKTVINGGSPDLILIDEAGNIPIVGDMVDQGRPTLFWVNPKTGLIEMKRQLILWGTGGDMEKGGEAYQALHDQCEEAFNDKYFNFGIVPLFIDAYAKPGITKAFLDQEMEVAYRKKGPEGAKSRVVYHQTYPITKADVFMTSLDTLIPLPEINDHIDRINKSKTIPRKGYFEPVYDTNSPLDEDSFVPYKIKGSQFVPITDKEIATQPEKVIVTIYKEPEKGWKNRYYHAVDPIFSSSGHSKFGAAIWDSLSSEPNKVSAEVNFRDSDYRYCYLQGLLLQLYYAQACEDIMSIPSLVEYNMGTGYVDFVDALGFYNTLTPNIMLPDALRTGSIHIGIRKGNNSRVLVNRIEELLRVYASNIWSLEFYTQVKSFVKKTTAAGNERYEPQNKKYHYDDIIDADLYAYLNAKAWEHEEPVNMFEHGRKRMKTIMRYDYDNNFNVVLKPHKVPV